jgi:hypothetical protein
MRCLTDVEIRALADAEGTAAASAHVDGCAACADRLADARRALGAVTAVVETAGAMPPPVESRIRRAITSSGERRGSTVLRTAPPGRGFARGLVPAAAAAAVVAVVVFGVLPRLDAPTTLSASQILGRSLETLSAGQGVELLEYEVVTAGTVQGRWRIEHLIDHALPTRYRVATYTEDGTIEAALSQDPLRGRRSQLVRAGGRNYIVSVGAIPHPILSLPQLMQAFVETAIAMMQATSDQKLTVVDGVSGREYVVEIPAVRPTRSTATLDLHHARAVVDATDFRIREFAAGGTLLRQPFDVSVRLLRRSVRAAGAVAPSEFEIVAGPGDVVMQGVAAEEPFRELLDTILRDLAAARGL